MHGASAARLCVTGTDGPRRTACRGRGLARGNRAREAGGPRLNGGAKTDKAKRRPPQPPANPGIAQKKGLEACA
eukprot:9936737-Lingulodinium_polyedra.AAC.1